MYPVELKRGQERSRLRILKKAFDRLGDSISEKRRNREKAISCTQSACLRSACGDGEAARAWMEKALQFDATLFVPPARELVTTLGQFVENLYEFGTPPPEARVVIERLCGAVPLEARQVRSLQHGVLGHFLGVHAFGRYESGSSWEALTSALAAIGRSPGWLRNRGLVSIAARSALGIRRRLP